MGSGQGAKKFLSTPSARRATYASSQRTGSKMISIHALREEGDARRSAGSGWHSTISIHALREEGDCLCVYVVGVGDQFLSTPSARRATDVLRFAVGPCNISIHALREEGDVLVFFLKALLHDFYPRPPRGGRRLLLRIWRWIWYFYPRPPRGGRLTPVTAIAAVHRNFYPRPPRGGRRRHCPMWTLLRAFLSTPSARRAT